MSDESSKTVPAAASEAADIAKDVPAATELSKSDATATEPGAKSNDAMPATAEPAEKSVNPDSDDNQEVVAKASEPEKQSEETDVEMKDANETEATSSLAEAEQESEKPSTEAPQDAPAAAKATAESTPKPKSKAVRKSTGGATSTGKKLNKKGSRARIFHTDAQPGDHFFVKLKGHPKWPVIICDDEMLPLNLLNTRPVAAKRADGTYREEFADDGKKVHQRSFPVMYLHTNEFGWVHNAELQDLNPDTLTEPKDNLRNDNLKEAYKLASESHPLSFYKNVLEEFQADLIEQQKRQEAKPATTSGKKKKAKAVVDDDGDKDVDMDDDDGDGEIMLPKKTPKRKADKIEAPAQTDSVKKPKIKLTTSSTPKVTNGVSGTPKTTKTADTKGATKSKTKKAKEPEEKQSQPEPALKSPELSLEEKHQRKEKEVLFLRHRLQKGLITRDNEPKPEEMKAMSDYVTKLEAMPDLEVSIIRATKINKVLKAILKLERIPKEDEFRFKSRSQVLLDQWNKLLVADGANTAAENFNSVNGEKTKPEKTNGVKDEVESKSAKNDKTDDADDADDKTDKAEEPDDKMDVDGDTAEKPATEAKTSETDEASA